MKCAKFCEIISVYVDSEANALEQLALQEHLKGCNTCKNELITQYTLKDMVKEYNSGAPEVNITPKVMSRLAASQHGAFRPEHNSFIIKHSKWMVATVVITLTAIALFSAHMSTHTMIADNMDREMRYTEYVYAHVSDTGNTNSEYSNSAAQQVSLIK